MTTPRDRFIVALAVAFASALSLLTTRWAAAQAHDGDAARPTDSDAPAYTLDVDSDAPDVLSHDAIALPLADELGAAISRVGSKPPSRAAIYVRYRHASRSLRVRATLTSGRTVERDVATGEEAASVQREAILLAGNLARDEARELIDALGARSPPSPPAPPRPEAPVAELAEPAPPDTLPSPSPPEERRLVNLSFMYPLATNLGHPDVTTSFSLSILYGRVGRVHGFDLGSGVTYASRGVHGAQLATALALSTGATAGFQSAAGAAISTDRVEGAQLAPVTVGQDVRGAQIGIVNVGRRVKGLQLGLVNVSEEVEGAAIGVVTITRDFFHPIVWTSNLAYSSLGVKFATKYTYTVTALGFGTLETDLQVDGISFTVAVGGRVPIGNRFDIEMETAYSEQDLEAKAKANRALHPRVIAGYAFAKRLRLFAGNGIRVPLAFDRGSPAVRPEFVFGVQF